WTYGGVIMPPAGSSFTNHPGVVDYKGRSYLFYHNGALPGGGGFHRSVCAAEFEYNADGSIPEIPMNSARRPGVGSLNPYIQQEAETIAWNSGIETERCAEGGMNVSEISNGDWIKVLGVNFVDGASSFEARVASAASGGYIEIHLDGENGTLAGTCAVAGTGDWQSWETVTCDVSGVTGMHDVYFKFTGSGNTLFNFNWWKFNK
ncbi:MAG: carbohydrate-binding protein, partial [Deltaproteobacteria bacterium]|nr:carbohydrate-binding protein [Deltaproteobacteria bacterium]